MKNCRSIDRSCAINSGATSFCRFYLRIIRNNERNGKRIDYKRYGRWIENEKWREWSLFGSIAKD